VRVLKQLFAINALLLGLKPPSQSQTQSQTVIGSRNETSHGSGYGNRDDDAIDCTGVCRDT
jgi:hypothetical protein